MKKFIRKYERWLEKHLGEHISVGPLTIYGFNAMHVAIDLWIKPWRCYICFHPTVYHMRWWPWYFYISPNATPWAATFAIGPGVWERDKKRARRRRRLLKCLKRGSR